MLSLRIAIRYLLAPKSHRAVNVISMISLAGVAVAAMAIIVVLSVFNGFSDLATTRLSLMDPDLKAEPVHGKVFARADSLARLVENIDGVAAAMPVLSERALLTGDKSQMPVRILGVDSAGVEAVMNLDSVIIDGVYLDSSPLTGDAAIQLSVGAAIETGLRPDPGNAATIYIPRRKGRINPANPAAAYRQLRATVSGVFQVDQPEYDTDFIIAPVDKLRGLLEYDDSEASALYISLKPGADKTEVSKAIASALGEGIRLVPRNMQHAETFRMIAVEKYVTFLMLVFILLIASFNIISTLSLLVIEKRDDMATLRALGASRRNVRGIFIAEGWLITVIGGVAGIILGSALVLLQQHFGIIKLEGDPSTLSVTSYPVRLALGDLALVAATVLIVGTLISQISRLFTRNI